MANYKQLTNSFRPNNTGTSASRSIMVMILGGNPVPGEFLKLNPIKLGDKFADHEGMHVVSSSEGVIVLENGVPILHGPYTYSFYLIPFIDEVRRKIIFICCGYNERRDQARMEVHDIDCKEETIVTTLEYSGLIKTISELRYVQGLSTILCKKRKFYKFEIQWVDGKYMIAINGTLVSYNNVRVNKIPSNYPCFTEGDVIKLDNSREPKFTYGKIEVCAAVPNSRGDVIVCCNHNGLVYLVTPDMASTQLLVPDFYCCDGVTFDAMDCLVYLGDAYRAIRHHIFDTNGYTTEDIPGIPSDRTVLNINPDGDTYIVTRVYSNLEDTYRIYWEVTVHPIYNAP